MGTCELPVKIKQKSFCWFVDASNFTNFSSLLSKSLY